MTPPLIRTLLILRLRVRSFLSRLLSLTLFMRRSGRYIRMWWISFHKLRVLLLLLLGLCLRTSLWLLLLLLISLFSLIGLRVFARLCLRLTLAWLLFWLPVVPTPLLPQRISRIRRNLSIHIARFSASESPRAIYQHSQNSQFRW